MLARRGALVALLLHLAAAPLLVAAFVTGDTRLLVGAVVLLAVASLVRHGAATVRVPMEVLARAQLGSGEWLVPPSPSATTPDGATGDQPDASRGTAR